MISLGLHIMILQFDLEIKSKDGFIATEYFEVAQNAFGRTCWNDTQVRLLGREVTDGYSPSNSVGNL
jgi:hypothetical protein